MTHDPLLEQRVAFLEDNQRNMSSEVKEMERSIRKELKEVIQRVNNHDRTIDKMELITENLKSDWTKVDTKIENMVSGQNKLIIETQKTFEIQSNMVKEATQMVLDAQKNAEAQAQSDSTIIDKLITAGLDIIKIIVALALGALGLKAAGKL